MVGAATKASDKDIGIDETGHLRRCVKWFHRDRKRTYWSMKRRVVDGPEGSHPLRSISEIRILIRMCCEAAELLCRPVLQRFVIACGQCVKPQLQPVIKI